MPTPPVPDDILRETVRVFWENDSNQIRASEALSISRSALQGRLKTAAKRGMMGTRPLLPGFYLKQTSTQLGPDGELQREWIKQSPEPGEPFSVPDGHAIKGVSALVDSSGHVVQQWIKTKEGELDPLAVADALKAAFADYQPSSPISIPPARTSADLLSFIPLADWHIGMYAWHREVGQNWDLDIAEQTIGESIVDLVSRSPACDQAIVLGGGDLIHSDNNDNKTARSGNILQVDGRYDKVIATASRLVARTVDAALSRHGHVTLRLLKGNHDKHASVAVAYHMLGWYRHEPRVTVDVDPSLFWWHRFGSVLLGATHGDECKIENMASIMAHRRAEDWGVTKFRYVHGFHLHHSRKYATEGGGVISEVHQAPIPQDAWNYGSGFLSGRSLQVITYHAKYGEVSRDRVAIMDAEAA